MQSLKNFFYWRNYTSALLLLVVGLLSGTTAFANVSQEVGKNLNLTSSWVGIVALLFFVAGYLLVIFEEQIHLRKSKPMMLVAALIWLLIGLVYVMHDMPDVVEGALKHNFLEYAELFFFLLVAMTYINAMMERGVFDGLRQWLVNKGFSFRSLFWLTGLLAFFISPVADNLTTALIMCAVVLAVADGNSKYIGLSCINIVIAANAGGAFSPFGDITTLMVWQKGVVHFGEFFELFIPSLINWVVPAAIFHFFIPKGFPMKGKSEGNLIKVGGLVIVGLFFLTVITAVCVHTYLNLPPVFGMMTGLAYLKIFGYYLTLKSGNYDGTENPPGSTENPYSFDVFSRIALAEWDTLFFFYGVILSVGGLGFLGYLALASELMYGNLGPLGANVLIGFLSAIVDNIPVMFAVLSMEPDMSVNEWLLVTLTAGVGGSMLSIGSAAGVALMGQARGQYTFFMHLKWTPVIILGYFASIAAHLLINGS